MSQMTLLQPEKTKYQLSLIDRFGEWWYDKLGAYLNSDFKTDLLPKIKQLPAFYPNGKNLFKAYKLTPDPNIIILGQSPYHDEHNGVIQATGLAFECAYKPSISIKRLLHPQINSMDLIGFEPVLLKSWVEQKVMLLNKALTITKGNSKDFPTHDIYTPLIRKTLDVCLTKPNMVYIMYGSAARGMITKRMRELHESGNIFIHESVHPAAIGYGSYSQDDFDNGFDKVNEYLSKNNLPKITWTNIY